MQMKADDLHVYKECHSFVLKIYILSKEFMHSI